MGNNCNTGCFGNDNSWIWILLALLFFCNDGLGGICNVGNTGCGRDDNTWVWIIAAIIFFCCFCNNNDRCC